MTDLTGVVVAVTGAARGIGFATANAFAHAGAHVVIGDIDVGAAGDAASRIEATGAAASYERVDVRDPESFAAFVAAADAVSPDGLGVLVNNAGVAHAATFLGTPAALRQLQLDVNLGGVVNGLAAALPLMTARGRGHVVNVASLAGRLATPNAAMYTATKFAVVGLTEAVRAELHTSGVRVSAVLPTFVPTEMTEGLPLTGIPKVAAADVARAIVRVARRGGPALTTVPRWMGVLPRLAVLAPQRAQDAIRRAAAGSPTEISAGREGYIARVRTQLGRD